MEGVGARLGRSSTRYGPSSTVFNGPVRKWKKKWVPPPPSSSNNNATSNHQSSTTTNHHNNGNNNSNSNGPSHLLLYKWTPISQSQNGNSSNDDKSSPHNAAAAASEEPPRRKFKYIPIAVLEEQRNEAEEDETKPIDKPDINNGLDDKPDMNDMPMEESQPPDDTPLTRQDLNVSTLDLSLGLKASDGDADSDGKED